MKLVILDRDGVVCQDPGGRQFKADAWRAMPGAPQAIARLNHAGWRVALMADCDPMSRGACDMATLNALHARIIEDVGQQGGSIDAVFLVPASTASTASDQCGVIAGTLTDALGRLDTQAGSTIVVSDSRHELLGAHAAGCQPILVLTGEGCQTLHGPALPVETLVRTDLTAVAAELAP